MFGYHISRISAGLRSSSLLLMAGTVLLINVPSDSAGESATMQGLAAEVAGEISWGSANGCVQNIRTDSFGALTPQSDSSRVEPFDASPATSASVDSRGDHVWVGCVTTNTGLASVTAQGLTDMTSAGHTLPLADVHIGITNSVGGSLGGGLAGCAVPADQRAPGGCAVPAVGAPQTLLSEASAGTTELNWQYQLDLPANQAVGDYTGGEVIFTATASTSQGSGGPETPTPPTGGPSGGPCDDTWTGGAGDGLWETGANWTTDSKPGPHDHACILTESTVTVTADANQVGWVTDQGTLVIVNHASLSINGPPISTFVNLTLSGGTLTGAGEVDVARSFAAAAATARWKALGHCC